MKNNLSDVNNYLFEQLERLNDNSCDDKICELINGVISHLDKNDD